MPEPESTREPQPDAEAAPEAPQEEEEPEAGPPQSVPPTELDAEERVRLLFDRYIKAKWVDPVQCPVCKTSRWSFTAPGDLRLRYRDEKVYTLIPVRCANCAYTMFFNAVAAGLFDDDSEPVELLPPEVEPEEPGEKAGQP